MLLVFVGVWLFGMIVVAEDPAFMDWNAYSDVAWELRLTPYDHETEDENTAWENASTTMVLA
jgi:hypothetical protein